MARVTTQLAVAPKLRAQPMALPICRPKPVDLARDLGEQSCLIWVGRHQVVMAVEPTLWLLWSGKHICSPAQLVSIAFSPT